MKTEVEVKARLKEAQKDLRKTRKRFDEYDNHDDLELIPVYEAEVNILNWILASTIPAHSPSK